jgi:hypothetical protein
MVVVYSNGMKELKKILLLGLGPALGAALAEQLPPGDFTVIQGQDGARDDNLFDLVVATGEKTPSFPGCPVLTLPPPPLRLGPVLRRIGQALADPVLHLADIRIGAWTFSPQDRGLTGADGKTIPLTDRETDMLACLARHRGRTVSREDLLKSVWRYQDGVDTHTLETHIYRLRQKTGPDFPLLTLEGGYALKTDGVV